MTENLLILFARYPRSGQVKTRLFPLLSADEAEQLYRAFLRDLVDRLRRSESFKMQIMVAGDPGDADRMRNLPEFSQTDQESIHFSPQEGEGLGERLEHAFDTAFSEGWKRIIILGADHPSVPIDYIEQGFFCLLDQDLVVGPSEDGGFYAVGLSRPQKDLLMQLPWSRPELYSEFIRRIEQRGDLRYEQIPLWYDIDRPEDLIRLAGSKAELSELPATAAILDRFDLESAPRESDHTEAR